MSYFANPWVLIDIFNLILSVGIFFLGLWGYITTKESALFLIGIAFALFGCAHLAALLVLTTSFSLPLIIMRIVAYLLVAFAMNKLVFSKE